MAAVRLKWTLIGFFSFFCALLASVNGIDYLAYHINDDEVTHQNYHQIHVVPLERHRRYVETAIPRLADNYFRSESSKTLDKDDLDSFSRRRGRMEMLGNLAISAEQLEAAITPSNEHSASHADHAVSNDDKPTKKPTGIAVKKNLESQVGKTSTTLNVNMQDEMHHANPLDPMNSTDTSHSINNSSPPTDQPLLEHNVTEGTEMHNTTVTQHSDGPETVAADGGGAHNNYSDDATTDLSDADFPKDISNNTLLKNNITDKQVDRHTYYNNSFIVDANIAKHFWVEMDDNKEVIVNQMLSKSHRRAATVKLKFDFPFYGHIVKSVTIATGGFLYTGDYIHSWLAATQYIAPLMANFDTGISNDSQVRYYDNGTAFTVEWHRVHLQDKKEAGQFTFQTTLHENGDIVFVYKEIPISVTHIEDTQHPVKVGLSDAYIIDRTVFFVRRKTIYEYHRVNFKREDIKNWTVIYMAALPTCHSFTDCNSCVTKGTTLDCKWCPAVNRCSSGYDRNRQEWQLHQCDHTAVNTSDGCLAANSSTVISERHHLDGHMINAGQDNNIANSQAATDDNMKNSEKSSHLGHSGLLGLLFFILIISGVSLWLLYAYRNPHTASGQVLIKYRPSQWSLRRGEARYTAATIHM